MKHIIIVHGDKGGVGKTTVAGLSADYAVKKHGSVVVVEGDLKIGDIARRFRGVAGVQGLAVDLARPDGSEDAAVALFSEIEKLDADLVVINTPASASLTIDRQADIIVPAAHDLGYAVHVAWLLGPGDDSARLAGESQLCRLADRKVAIVNKAFGQTIAWAHHPARAAWLESGGIEGELPVLSERTMAAVRDLPGRYSVIAQDLGALNTIQRSAVHRWVHASWVSAIVPIFGE